MEPSENGRWGSEYNSASTDFFNSPLAEVVLVGQTEMNTICYTAPLGDACSAWGAGACSTSLRFRFQILDVVDCFVVVPDYDGADGDAEQKRHEFC